MAGDDQKDGKPTVALTFAQLVGLAVFILGLIGGFAALLYESIDKRLDKMEEKLEDGLKEHDGRLDDLNEKVSVQEVKLLHLEMMRAAEKGPPLVAMGDGDGDDDEGAEGSEAPRARRRRGRGSGLVAMSDPGPAPIPMMREPEPVPPPKPVAMHAPEGVEGSEPPEDLDLDGDHLIEPEGYPESNAIVIQSAPERRAARKEERCRKRWRRGCPIDQHPFEGNLRGASDELAQMQLREASNRLSRLQNKEAG